MGQPGGERRVRRSRSWLAGALALGLIGAACGGSGEGVVSDGDQSPGTSSSPITAKVPDDWQLVTAGVGNNEQTWGQDCCGSDEPYTVVKRSGDDGSFMVAATGYETYQGGLQQASQGYMADTAEFEVDGRRAILAQGSESGFPTGLVDLVVDLDGTSALRAQGIDASRDELVDLVSAATVGDDHRSAPRFEQLQAGFELVGSVNGSGVMALRSFLQPGTDQVPGDDRTHTLGWTVGPADAAASNQPTVTVSAVPADTISLDALQLALPDPDTERTVEPAQVNGRPALQVVNVQSAPWRTQTLVAETEWGDQLVVTTGTVGNAGAQPLSFDLLEQVAASVEPADPDIWDGLVEEASGGPGLTANVGRTEVSRGEAGGIEWLLQTGDDVEGSMGPPGLDGCLKLDGGDPACPMMGTGTRDGSGGPPRGMSTGTLGPDELSFVIMAIPNDDPAVELRFTIDERTVIAPFHPIPGDDGKAAVLVAERGDSLTCRESGLPLNPAPDPGQPPEPTPDPGLLERLDADGNSLGCLDD